MNDSAPEAEAFGASKCGDGAYPVGSPGSHFIIMLTKESTFLRVSSFRQTQIYGKSLEKGPGLVDVGVVDEALGFPTS